MQVIEPKHFNIKSQGFIAVFITRPVELTESCSKKQELTLCKAKKLKKAFMLQKTDWQHIIKIYLASNSSSSNSEWLWASYLIFWAPVWWFVFKCIQLAFMTSKLIRCPLCPAQVFRHSLCPKEFTVLWEEAHRILVFYCLVLKCCPVPSAVLNILYSIHLFISYKSSMKMLVPSITNDKTED